MTKSKNFRNELKKNKSLAQLIDQEMIKNLHDIIAGYILIN